METCKDIEPVASWAFPGGLWIYQLGCCPLPEAVPPQEPGKQQGLNANRIWFLFIGTCFTFCESVLFFFNGEFGVGL